MAPCMLPFRHNTAIEPFSPIVMDPWHVSATTSTGNVLIRNEGGKFQSMWEVADVSTIITSSKSNQQDWEQI